MRTNSTPLLGVRLAGWACVALLLLLASRPLQALASTEPKGSTGPEDGVGVGRYAMVSGLRMYYEVHGSGNPVVLLHGAFGMAEHWAAFLPSLMKRQVIILEQQGHARTADRDAPLTYEQMADDTAALLKQLGVRGADVFGYSDGGIVGIGLAIRHPELVGRLAVIGATPGRLQDDYEPEMFAQFQGLPLDFAPDVLKKPYDLVAPDKSKWPVLVRKIKSLGLDFKGYTIEQVRSIQVPTLVMLGDREGIKPERAVAMFRTIPNAQLAIFPGADHFFITTNPDKVLATLMPFLEAPLPAAKPPAPAPGKE